MNLDKSILDEFKDKTQKDIEDFLQRITTFLKVDRVNIVNYYKGVSQSPNSASFQSFFNLKRELKQVFEIFQLHAKSFQNSRWWDLIEVLEGIDSAFSSLENTNRWSRSSLTKFGYDPFLKLNYTISENQTLERISQDVLLQADPNNQWYDIAISNTLTEEDYTVNGGASVGLTVPRINNRIQLQSVMDVMEGKTVYGKDLDKVTQYVTDENGYTDLKVLDFDQTILQSAEILTTLKKNSNPDFPNDGLQTSVAVGGNRALLNFPVIVRQLTKTFATDDTLQNFVVKNLGFDQDNLLISYEVETRLNETYTGESTL